MYIDRAGGLTRGQMPSHHLGLGNFGRNRKNVTEPNLFRFPNINRNFVNNQIFHFVYCRVHWNLPPDNLFGLLYYLSYFLFDFLNNTDLVDCNRFSGSAVCSALADEKSRRDASHCSCCCEIRAKFFGGGCRAKLGRSYGRCYCRHRREEEGSMFTPSE